MFLKTIKYICFVIAVFSYLNGVAQNDSLARPNLALSNNAPAAAIDSSKQRDLIDFLQKILKKNTPANSRLHAKKLVFSVVPAIGYSLTTGFAADITANMAFYTSTNHSNNLSAIDLETYMIPKIKRYLPAGPKYGTTAIIIN